MAITDTFKALALAEKSDDGAMFDRVAEGSGYDPDLVTESYIHWKKTGKAVEPSPLTAMRQGQTLGFADELAGVGSALGGALAGDFNLAENYRGRRDAERLAADMYATANPGRSAGLAIASGAAMPPIFRAAGPASTVLGRTGQAAKLGAQYGAVGGLGVAEGTPVEQGITTAGGAAVGALLGPAISLGAEGVAAIPSVIRGIANRGKVAIPAAEQRVVPSLTPTAQPIPQVAPAESVNVGPRNTAAAQLMDALIADGVPPDQARQMIAARALSPVTAGTKPMTIADIAPTGGATQRLVRGARVISPATGGSADQFLTGRDRLQAERMIGDFNVTSGIPDIAPAQMQREMTAAAREKAGPLYKQVREAGQVNIAQVEPFVNTSYFQQARAHIENIPKLRDKNINDAAVLDEMYKYLGGIRDKREMSYPEQEAVKGLMDAIKGSIDEATGGLYSKATGAYAGEMVGSEAIAQGAKIFNKSSATVRDELAQLNPEEQTAYRTAAADAIREKLRNLNYNRDAVKSVFNNDAIVSKMRAVFGSDKAFREFENQVIDEASMVATKNVVMGNSQTVDKATDAMRAGGYADILANAVLNPGQAVSSAMQAGIGTAARGMLPGAEQRGSAILNMALNPDVGQNLGLLDELIRLSQQEARKKGAQGLVTRASAGAGAAVAPGVSPLIQGRQ